MSVSGVNIEAEGPDWCSFKMEWEGGYRCVWIGLSAW
jgi:hypothetical protein